MDLIVRGKKSTRDDKNYSIIFAEICSTACIQQGFNLENYLFIATEFDQNIYIFFEYCMCSYSVLYILSS